MMKKKSDGETVRFAISDVEQTACSSTRNLFLQDNVS